ncbi:acetylornithine/succinylornithine family transaminase [Clostridium sp. LY3-2]|uniref:acetylornithine/succinylornithine family transaminase n=1 Tax=Clostridium sp. LY3-2 TaxID=2942482 RepID=UPI002152F245|nr:acetylornithine/succinylornithine family transaminase [Clostridium sp. LY3-2]MCR6513935.1 acetylornithine/succinylornithine family transaminase [Clostridium sp. LY3-2]
MDHSLLNTYAFLPVIMKRGSGVYLYDTFEKEYLDFGSGIGVNSLGYSNVSITNNIINQIIKLNHTSNIFLNDTIINLSNKLTALSNMSKVFFSNSGAEANECAIKLSRKYSFSKYKDKNRTTILSLEKSFHGRTLATLKLTGQEKFHDYFFPFPEGFKYTKANDIEDFKSSLTPDVCAVILESIQGEGGVIPLGLDYVRKVYEICKSKDVLLIFDEVQCGIGRTGKLFGFNHFDVIPNIITLAKGLGGGMPIGAVLCDSTLEDAFSPGDHGSTFGGNPVCASSALAVLERFEDDSLLNSVSNLGKLAFDILKENKKIISIRGRGLMIGIETKFNSSEVQKEALKEGLIVLTAGPNIIRLLPPLILTEKELIKGCKILLKVIDRME